MKSIIRLLLISLTVACSQSLSAESGLSLQKVKEIKSYIAAAQELNFSDEEIKLAFIKGLDEVDANGTVTLSLTNEYQKYALIVGGVTATAAVVGLGIYGYKKGWFSQNTQIQPDVNNQGNPVDSNEQPNIQPDVNEQPDNQPDVNNQDNPVDVNEQPNNQPDVDNEPNAPVDSVPSVVRSVTGRYNLRNVNRVNYRY